MIRDSSIDEAFAILALADEAPQRTAIRTFAAVVRELVGEREGVYRVFKPIVDIVGEHQMHPAPSGGKNRRLGIELLEAHRDSRGIDDRLAVVERDRRHGYLARCEQQFLALEVVDLDHFELD